MTCDLDVIILFFCCVYFLLTCIFNEDGICFYLFVFLLFYICQGSETVLLLSLLFYEVKKNLLCYCYLTGLSVEQDLLILIKFDLPQNCFN